MEIHGLMNVVILIFALAVPIAIATLVYRTLFSGLNSIPSSKISDADADGGEKQKQIKSQQQAEKESDS